MEKFDAQAAKFAHANMQHIAGDNGVHVAAQKVATKEFVRNSIAVDIIDIAKQMAKTCARAANLSVATFDSLQHASGQ